MDDLAELLEGAGLSHLVKIPMPEFVKEHRKLIRLLGKKKDPALRREAAAQAAELKKMTGGKMSKAAGFVRRAMAENSLKHQGQYKNPTAPLHPDSTMNKPLPFEYRKLANPGQGGTNEKEYGASPFIQRHFGQAEPVRFVRKIGRPPAYLTTGPFPTRQRRAVVVAPGEMPPMAAPMMEAPPVAMEEAPMAPPMPEAPPAVAPKQPTMAGPRPRKVLTPAQQFVADLKQREKERKQRIRERLIKERQEKPLTEEEKEFIRETHSKAKPTIAVRAPEPAAPAPVVEAPAEPRRNFAEERRQLISKFSDVNAENAAFQIAPEKYIGPGQKLVDRRQADEWMRHFYSGTIPDWVELDADERQALDRKLIDVREKIEANGRDLGDLLSGGLYDADVGAWANAIKDLTSKARRTRSSDNWVAIWTMVFLAFNKYRVRKFTVKKIPYDFSEYISVLSIPFLVGITNFFVRNKYTIEEISKLLQNKRVEGKPNVNLNVLATIVYGTVKNYLTFAGVASFPGATFNAVFNSWSHAQERLFVWFLSVLKGYGRPDSPIFEKLKDPSYDDAKLIDDVLQSFTGPSRSGNKFYQEVDYEFARRLLGPYPPEAPQQAPQPAGANAPRVVPVAPQQTDEEAEAELQRLLEEAGLT